MKTLSLEQLREIAKAGFNKILQPSLQLDKTRSFNRGSGFYLHAEHLDSSSDLEPISILHVFYGEEVVQFYSYGRGFNQLAAIRKMEELNLVINTNTISQQKAIIAEIAKAATEKPDSDFCNYIWFNPENANFLYADQPVKPEVICPLIENGTFMFTGTLPHQGERMLRYALNPNQK